MNIDEISVCARASELVYGESPNIADHTLCESELAEKGFSNFVWIQKQMAFKDLCAFVATSDTCHLLAFRGTEIPQDWMTDLACTPARFDWIFTAAPAIGEIHAGFGHCLADGITELIEILEGRDPGKPLLVTGHSLGGALAALAAAYFSIVGAAVPAVSAVYTFGQPRIGLHDFCNTCSRVLDGKLIRFVNKEDVVPRVPFRGFDYSDEGIMVHFDSSGKPELQSPQWQGFLARTIQSVEDAVEIAGHLGTDLGDHSVTGYREVVDNNKEALGALLQGLN